MVSVVEIVTYQISVENAIKTIKTTGVPSRYLHSPRNPVAEARRLLVSVAPGGIWVIQGCGLGYVVAEAVQDSRPYFKILVIESDPGLHAIFEAENPDSSSLLAHPKIGWCVGESPEAIAARFEEQTDWSLVPISFVSVSAVVAINSDYYAAVRHAILDALDRVRVRHNTMGLYQSVISRNYVTNAIGRGSRLDLPAARGSYTGCPALVLGAGPSLRAAMPTIQALRSSVVCVGVDSTVSVMGDHAIIPDFLMAVDYRRENGAHFGGIDRWTTVPLIADFQVDPAIIAAYPGPIGWIANEIGIAQWRGRVPVLPGYLNVTHAGILWAHYLGCSPILVAGMDLCFPNGEIYASDRPHKIITTESGRFMDVGSVVAGIRGRQPIIQTQNWRGEWVDTTPSLKTYIYGLESVIKSRGLRVVMIGSDGARVAGADYVDDPMAIISPRSVRHRSIPAVDDESDAPRFPWELWQSNRLVAETAVADWPRPDAIAALHRLDAAIYTAPIGSFLAQVEYGLYLDARRALINHHLNPEDMDGLRDYFAKIWKAVGAGIDMVTTGLAV